MDPIFLPKKLHKFARIDKVVREYIDMNPSIPEVLAKNLVPLFVQKGIFLKDHRNGLTIRILLRQLDAAKKLDMIRHCKVVRTEVNRNWYFAR